MPSAVAIKQEPMPPSSSSQNGKRPAHGQCDGDSDLSSDEDNLPLSKRQKTSQDSVADGSSDGEGDDTLLAVSNGQNQDDDSDSDAPLTSTVPSALTSESNSRAGSTRRTIKSESNASDSDDDSDAPLTSVKTRETPSDNGDGDDDDDDDDGQDEEDEEEEEADNSGDVGRKTGAKKQPKMSINGSGEKKWNTLIHKGPRFPDPYTPLPKGVYLKYDGKQVPLPPETEEIAMFYAVKIETQHAQNPIFNRNFFQDFQAELKKFPPLDGTKLKFFEKLDFRDIYNHWRSQRDAEAERRKSLAPSARKRELEEKKAQELAWKTCLVDGVEQLVGNVNVEPPGLFLGRGAHPKAGRIKTRVRPSDITINHSSNHPIPKPPVGGTWAEVVEKKDVTWLAYWKENVNGQYKYVFLDATSNFKTNSDREKFEKARRLDKVVKRIRQDLNKNLKSKNRQERQIATIVWLIDNFSLRAGNEKGEDEAETYGVCSLRCEHAQIKPPNQIHLEFLGKDSMKFEEDLTIGNPDVFKNVCMFLKTNGQKDGKGQFIRKNPSDPIFCGPIESASGKLQPMAPDMVNKFLSKYMKGLSAKVFRTYNASVTFQGLLDQTEEWLQSRPKPQEREITPANLRLAYNEANRQVAILCNHQKTINPVTLTKSLERSQEKIFGFRYEIHKEQQKMLSKYKVSEIKKEFPVKDHPFMTQLDKILELQHLDPDKVRQFEKQMIADKKAKLQNAFQRQQSELKYQLDQLKRKSKMGSVAEDEIKASIRGYKEKEQVDKELKELDDALEKLSQEREKGTSLVTSFNLPTSARKILSKFEAIKRQEADLVNKNNTSDVSLGTSKLNYIDPRITLSWLKKWDNRLTEMGKGKKKAAIKKEDEDDEGGKSRKGKKGVKKEEEEQDTDEPKTPKGRKAKNATPKKEVRSNSNGDSEKIDLGLQVMQTSQFFALALQKKFKWAATGDDDREISEKWTFADNAQSKMRRFESAERKDGKASSSSMVAMTEESEHVEPSTSPGKRKAKTEGKGCAATLAGNKRQPKKQAAASKRKRAAAKAVDGDSSDDDKPLAAS